MWSSDRLRPLRGLGLALVLPLALAGCFRPLYAEAPSGGSVPAMMAGIVVEQVPDRVGHYLVEELKFELDGSGATHQPRYRLSMEAQERIGTAIISSLTGRAESATVTVDVNFTLKAVGTNDTVLSGRATASASYDRSPQRFAATRAARDAEIRIARQLADQIRTRIAAYFATRA